MSEQQSQYVPTNPFEKASLAMSKVILSLPKKIVGLASKKKSPGQSVDVPTGTQTMTIESAKNNVKKEATPPVKSTVLEETTSDLSFSKMPKVSIKLPKIKLGKKSIVLVAVVVVTIVIIFVLMAIFRGNGKLPEIINLEPTATPTPVEVELDIPSIYSNDPVIIKLKEDAEVLDHELGTVQLQESTLSVPRLDFELNFEKK